MHLNVDSDLSPFTITHFQDLSGFVFLTALVLAIWFTARRRQFYPIAFGLLWFIITQLPTSLYPLSEVENDHRMFFSFVGLILAAVWTTALLLRRIATPRQRVHLRLALIAVSVAVLAGYAWGTHQRNLVWHDEESLWLDDVVKSPHNGRGLMIYGLTRMGKGDYSAALDYFERALLYTPTYPTLEINLGVVNGALADAGDAARTAEAERHFRRAIALAPQDDTVHAYYGRWLNDHGRSTEAVAQLQMAVALNPQRLFQRDQLIEAYSRSGNLDAARQVAQDAIALAPTDVMARQALAPAAAQNAAYWIDLSLAQYKQGQYQQSIESAQRALTLDPNSAEAYNNIGAARAGMQQWDAAIDSEREALRRNPKLQIAQNNLDWYTKQKAAIGSKTPTTADGFLDESLRLNQASKYDESSAAARKALHLNPQSAEAWNNIAANNEALHRWDEAIAAAQKAIALKPDFQLAKNNLAWSLSQKKLGAH